MQTENNTEKLLEELKELLIAKDKREDEKYQEFIDKSKEAKEITFWGIKVSTILTNIIFVIVMGILGLIWAFVLLPKENERQIVKIKYILNRNIPKIEEGFKESGQKVDLLDFENLKEEN
jgi:ABC-type siderophore export system fused ATPase/permease subunit